MYELNILVCCLRLTDMFQVCSKLTFRKIRCSAKIKDPHFLIFKVVIREQNNVDYYNDVLEQDNG